ncbi:MAG: BspA family leucine-rich repeat surface protein [Prevotella sp.]|nr:BspA family leucine-rich repeat surface protein [Prevotella sp.]
MKKYLLYKTVLVLMTMLTVGTKMQAQEAYAVLSDDGLTVTFYYDTQKASRGGIDINNSYISSGSSLYGNATTAVIDASFANYRPTSTAYWFQNCRVLMTITGMENLKTENVTDMRSMFRNCTKLTTLDVSNFNTANVTDMSYMFSACNNLANLDVSNFNTADVRIMCGLFQSCSKLTSIDVSNFNTANVTNMSYMFNDCSKLTSLDLSSFNTANVTDMRYMFSESRSLKSIDVSGFNTAKVTNMMGMFGLCSGLTSLDLSSFNTANVTDMSWMFQSCSNLTTIYAGDGWSTAKVTSGGSMFSSCTKLVGGQGTVFNTAHRDYRYAHIDGGTTNPGYFTDKAAIEQPLAGDISGDGVVNAKDLTMITNYILGNTSGVTLEKADVNGDGKVDVSDVVKEVQLINGTTF